MKKYKLLAQLGYPIYKYMKNNIYNEDYKFYPYNLTVKELVKRWPNDWELVEDDFVLPEKWCIKSTPETFNIIQDYCRQKLMRSPLDVDQDSFYHFPEFKIKGCTSSNIKLGYTEITFEQFKTHVLNMKEEKEIIGYKAPYTINTVIDKGTLYILHGNNYCPKGKEGKGSEWYLPPQIIEQWEPVYKETIPQIEINGYKGKFFDEYVKFGCAEINKQCFIDLYKFHNISYKGQNKGIESVTIGKGTFTKEQIKLIAEYYLNKEK